MSALARYLERPRSCRPLAASSAGARFLMLLLPVLLALAWARSVGAEAPQRLSLDQIGKAFGISRDDVDALRRGERVGGDLESVSENELALSIALRAPATPAFLWDYVQQERGFRQDPTVVQYGAVGEDAAAALAPLRLPEEEIERLAEAEPGDDINLSKEEIASLQAIVAATKKGAARNEALLEGFRRILAGRIEAFRAGGLGAVVPYDRGGGEVGAPAVELGRALGELHATRKLAPGAYGAVATPRRPLAEGVQRRFYWVVHGAEDEVLVTLAHRVFAKRNDHVILIDHRFYVNHTLNSMQAVSVVVPTEEGSFAIYANRTFTDRVAGFAGAVARKIGGVIMRSKLDEVVDAFEESLED